MKGEIFVLMKSRKKFVNIFAVSKIVDYKHARIFVLYFMEHRLKEFKKKTMN